MTLLLYCAQILRLILKETLMPAVIIKHKVKDYSTWLAAFEAHSTAREAAGVEKAMVWQEAGDPNSVVALMKVDNLDSARAFMANPELKVVMEAAGVIEEPTVFLVENGRKFDH